MRRGFITVAVIAVAVFVIFVLPNLYLADSTVSGGH
jgi:hypothetical protein